MSNEQSQQSSSVIPAKRSAAAMTGRSKGTPKPVKRRASKACQSCRARKVRCNVVEQSPCTNCRLDQVPCVVSESKRKRKSRPDNLSLDAAAYATQTKPDSHLNPISNHSTHRPSFESNFSAHSHQHHHHHHHHQEAHVPHPLYRTHGDRSVAIDPALQSASPESSGFTHSQTDSNGNDYILRMFANSYDKRPSRPTLPSYIKPLPTKLGSDDLDFLNRKTALDVPDDRVRSALLRGYLEFVHPFMPVLDLVEFLSALQHGEGTVSLFLFQSVMFAGSAFVDMSILRAAGFSTRREARKRFYQRARVLYDLDCETDRMTLVQAILMLTFWYEMPNDLKDTWHWMGLAASFAQTIGLNRDPARSSLSLKCQRQWKRVWWSCVMRDRLIALGMRRPTRIKAEDSDVPMLTLDDFEIMALPESLTCIPEACAIARDVEMQRSLARTCIEKAKLCVCISHVLAAQYSVPESGSISDDGITKTTGTLLPKKLDPERTEVKACHRELQYFYEYLPHDTQWHGIEGSDTLERSAPLIVNRALLHMVYFTTLSALHRPQVFAEAAAPPAPTSTSGWEALESSRAQVRIAAAKITDIAKDLLRVNWVRYLPTTGVTVLQPAIITHLLDIKATSEELRTQGLQGFCQCIQVLSRLSDAYAAADFSMALIEAAVRKADIQIPSNSKSQSNSSANTPSAHKWRKAWCTDDLVDAGVQQNLIPPLRRPLTPPPDLSSEDSPADPASYEEEVAEKLESFLASTPPDSEPSTAMPDREPETFMGGMVEFDFDALINTDALNDGLGKGGYASMQGESSGFTFDMDWLTTIKDHDILGSGVIADADVDADVDVDVDIDVNANVDADAGDAGNDVNDADDLSPGTIEDDQPMKVDVSA